MKRSPSRFGRVLRTSLALLFLGVSFLWDALAPPIEWVIDKIPLERTKRAVERFMDRLPPYPTLFVFLIPVVVIEPIKLGGVWFFAHKQFVAGVAVYAAAEILRFSLVAFLFKTCRDKLLSILWFAKLYGLFIRAHEWAHRQLEPAKAYLLAAFAEAGLAQGQGGMWRRVRAIWRYSRRRASAGA